MAPPLVLSLQQTWLTEQHIGGPDGHGDICSPPPHGPPLLPLLDGIPVEQCAELEQSASVLQGMHAACVRSVQAAVPIPAQHVSPAASQDAEPSPHGIVVVVQSPVGPVELPPPPWSEQTSYLPTHADRGGADEHSPLQS
jgi:hypothetical protein